MSDEELIARLRSWLIGVNVDKQAADRIEEYARAFTNLQREYGARGERIAELIDPVAVHANMLRGTIAKPTVEQIIHLYGVDALCKALAPVIVREAGYDPATDLAELVEALRIAGPIALGHFANHPFILNEDEKRKVAVISAALAKIKEPQT